MARKYFFVIALLLFIIISYFIAPRFPEFITNNYNGKLYPLIDALLHTLTNAVTFSLGDLFYALIICFVLYKTYIFIKTKAVVNLVKFFTLCILLFFGIFQLFWGLNNYKISVADQLELEKNYTETELNNITAYLINIVNKQHLQITNDTLQPVVIIKDLELFNNTAIASYHKLPEHLRKTLTGNTINNVKPSFYSYLQSYTGFSGYFNPLTHENQINIEIPTIGMPITVAHEMAHQLGIASEAEANFYGYMVMLQSNDLRFNYAANLYALKYCLKEYRIKNEETYQLHFSQLNSGVRQNIIESEQFWQSKRNVSSYFFKNLYGGFLKMNNQKDGIRSYNKFVDLLINYNKKYPQN